MPPQNGDVKYQTICFIKDEFQPYAIDPFMQGSDNLPEQVPPGAAGCATERLLRPDGPFVCDQRKAARQQELVRGQRRPGAACGARARPGYDRHCPLPLWSRTKRGFAGAMPYSGPYSSEAPYHYAESPYYMDNDDPRKFFMSGYTGFVPLTQSVIGNVFPLTCNKGLRKFADLQCNPGQSLCRPVLVRRDAEPPLEQLRQCSREPLRAINIADVGIEYDPGVLRDCGPGPASSVAAVAGSLYDSGGEPSGGRETEGAPPAPGPDGPRRKMKMFRRKDPHPIYRVEEGLLPTYGGHVPNQQFRFGGTFGRETLNARNLNKRK